MVLAQIFAKLRQIQSCKFSLSLFDQVPFDQVSFDQLSGHAPRHHVISAQLQITVIEIVVCLRTN